jgi:hypothetical protein
VNIEEFRMAMAPQFIQSLSANTGITRCDAYGPMEMTLTMTGETNGAGSGSVLLAVLGTAFVPVNSITTYFSAPTTGLYLQSGEITLARQEFSKFQTEFKAKAGIP